MKIIAPILLLYSLVCLTSPDGFGVWLQKEQIVSILRPTTSDCAPGSQTKVTMGNGTSVCVSESRKDVVKKIEDAR